MQKSVEHGMVMFMSPACLCKPIVLKEAKPIRALVVKATFESETSLGNALVSMYSRCGGSVKHARNVFDKLPRRDVFFWTAMICACAQHGLSKEAI
jgi:hypothetical protein